MTFWISRKLMFFAIFCFCNVLFFQCSVFAMNRNLGYIRGWLIRYSRACNSCNGHYLLIHFMITGLLFSVSFFFSKSVLKNKYILSKMYETSNAVSCSVNLLNIPVCIRTEKYFQNLIKATRNQIVFTTFRLIWNQTDVRLVPNQSENGKYNLISG